MITPHGDGIPIREVPVYASTWQGWLYVALSGFDQSDNLRHSDEPRRARSSQERPSTETAWLPESKEAP